jgi:hypothetical protein
VACYTGGRRRSEKLFREREEGRGIIER